MPAARHRADSRPIRLNLFAHGCGHHAAAWREPGSAVERLGDVRYWELLARTAERGCLDAVFLADGQSIGAGQARRRPSWFLEPITLLSALARATQRIGLVTTVSSTFGDPYHAARQLASLDHLSGGRVGVNVVTSMTDAEARNHGMAGLPDHDDRYARAGEFIDVMRALWASWPADSIVADRRGAYADPARIAPIDHRGARFEVAGPLNVPSSPQGAPVVFQAGASEQGRDLAGRCAEAVYSVAWDLPSARAHRRAVRRRAREHGRDPDRIAVMPGLVTFVASSEAEALACQAELDALLPEEDALAQLAFFVGVDTSRWRMDGPVPPLRPLDEFSGPKGRYRTVLRIIERERPTVRELLGHLGAGGGHATFVGTPERIADRIEHWVDAGGADGFNLMPPTLPGGIELFVDQVIPVLQRRGRFRRRYRGRTLRSHLGLAVDGPDSRS
ncbi:MAG: NtaA/DmoA family FMN-dependent monooxygenase [Microbacterium sp.]